jgi:thiol-disulfide isomerase/thioredoxin
MRRIHLSALAVIPLALALTAPQRAAAQDIGLDVGTRPSPIVMQDLDGNKVDLGMFIGRKPVLLEFWATWCPLCQGLQPAMDLAYKKYGTKVEFFIVAVGVSQTSASVKRHIAKHPLPGHVLWDGKGAAVRVFEAPTTSYVVLLDASGKVVYTGAGSDQDVVAAVAKTTARIGQLHRAGKT